jgi:hypothetical protein
VRRIALLAAAAAAAALLVPAGSASALGGTLTGSFLCENTLVTTTGTAGTAINAAPQSFTSTVVMPDSADAGTGASAQVTIAPAGAGTMPLSPPVALSGVEVDELQVRLDIYRSTTNSAVDITLPMDMSSGTAAVAPAALPQPASTPWALPSPFEVTVPVTGAAGQRAWVRVKSFGFTWSKAGEYTGSTTCRLVAAEAFPAGPTTVEQPIFGALTPLSRQFPVALTDVNLAGTEAQLRAEFADRVTFTGTTPPPTGDTCTVTNPSGCTTGQQITATVIAGTLTQQATAAGANPASTAITMRQQDATPGVAPYDGASAVTVSTAPQVMEGPLNPITVTDVRGGSAGWSLTAQLAGPLTEIGGGSIDEAQANLVVNACTPLAGSASRTPGTGGTLDAAVTLCGVDAGMDDSEGDSGSGQYTVTGRVDLTIPPFQRAGDYTSTIVVTLT